MDARPLLNAKDVAEMFADPAWAAKYPPILSLEQAADLIQKPKQTLYSWSSQGKLDRCARKVGKHIRIHRNKFIHLVFNEGIDEP